VSPLYVDSRQGRVDPHGRERLLIFFAEVVDLEDDKARVRSLGPLGTGPSRLITAAESE